MIPRITLRDADDSTIIQSALKAYVLSLRDEYAKLAAKPGADQYALTVELLGRCKMIFDVLTAVEDDSNAMITSLAEDATTKETGE